MTLGGRNGHPQSPHRTTQVQAGVAQLLLLIEARFRRRQGAEERLGHRAAARRRRAVGGARLHVRCQVGWPSHTSRAQRRPRGPAHRRLGVLCAVGRGQLLSWRRIRDVAPRSLVQDVSRSSVCRWRSAGEVGGGGLCVEVHQWDNERCARRSVPPKSAAPPVCTLQVARGRAGWLQLPMFPDALRLPSQQQLMLQSRAQYRQGLGRAASRAARLAARSGCCLTADRKI